MSVKSVSPNLTQTPRRRLWLRGSPVAGTRDDAPIANDLSLQPAIQSSQFFFCSDIIYRWLHIGYISYCVYVRIIHNSAFGVT
jgi:hypothetical protein